MELAGYVARSVEIINLYKVLIKNKEKPLTSPTTRHKDNIKVYPTATGCEGVYRVEWRTFVNIVINILVS